MALAPAAASSASPRIRAARLFQRRTVFWLLAVIAGVGTGFAVIRVMQVREERIQSADAAAIVRAEGDFKAVYTQWLDQGGVHDIPNSVAGWVKLQSNLFQKWTSQKGDRAGVGDGVGAVRPEVASRSGDPSQIRLPASVHGQIFDDAILVDGHLLLRLRAWGDGSVGWRATVARGSE